MLLSAFARDLLKDQASHTTGRLEFRHYRRQSGAGALNPVVSGLPVVSPDRSIAEIRQQL